jgi:foldase protein PrsA
LSTTNKATATIVAVLVTLAVAGTSGFMLGQSAGKSSINLETKAVATVNNEKITQLALYDRMVTEGGAATLDVMIKDKLVDQALKAANLTITDADMNAELAKLKERLGGEEAFQSAMAQQGLTLEKVKEYLAFDLKVVKVLSKDMQVDDAALKAYFDENMAQFDTREVHARHILVDTEDEAKAIKAQLDGGADFAALAKEKSTEPAAAESGGDLGTFKRGSMVAEFETVAFSLKPNEISAPVQSQFGWHVIQTLEVKGTAPTFDGVKAKVKDALIQEKVGEQAQVWLDELRSKATITNTLEG